MLFRSLDNAQLPDAYARADIVLNDHHEHMASLGFLSNRLFDAVAAGARVLSDRAKGLADVFGSSVVEFDSEDHLVELLATPADRLFPDGRQLREEGRRITREHSFDQRASVLIEHVRRLRGDSQ